MKKDLIGQIQRITERVFHTIAREAGVRPSSSLPAITLEQKDPKTFGDFSTGAAFVYASILQKPPITIAHDACSRITKELQSKIYSDIFAEVAGHGFINYHIGPGAWASIAQKLSAPRPRKSKTLFRKKILIEFSSPNIAKPMSIGHLRATILGDALARLYRHAGYKPISWNHLGDWGTQFGKLLVAYTTWGDPTIIEKNPIAELQKLYVAFHHRASKDPSLELMAREAFQKLEAGNKHYRSIWQKIVQWSLAEFNRFYALLHVSFDYIIGESFYEPMLKPFIDRLVRLGIAQKSQGALVIPLDHAHLPPLLIQKSDGATLYATRDLVSLVYRARKVRPYRMLYVVGNEQSLHFKQLQEANKKLHLTKIPFEHIAFGLVFNALGKKFSTRKGDIVTAHEVISDIYHEAQKIQKEKQPEQSDEERNYIAQSLSIGITKYGMLRQNRLSHITFNFEELFSLSGNSFPYLQYTYARLQSIRKKVSSTTRPIYKDLSSDDWNLVRVLIGFERAIDVCLDSHSLHFLADYLFGLANAANALYEKHHISTDGNAARQSARLNLITIAAQTLRYGLSLMGITMQEKL